MNTESILQRTRMMLSDISGVKFSDAQLQTALAQVLAEVNSKVPHVVNLCFTAMTVGQVLILPATYVIRNVLRVECLNDDPSQKFTFHFDENAPNEVEIMDAVESVELDWRVKIVTSHQIEGLDGAETSTIPDYGEMLMACGTAAYALQIRNTQLAESANQETVHYQALQQNMRLFEAQYQGMLLAWQSAQPAIEPVLPDGPGWQLDD